MVSVVIVDTKLLLMVFVMMSRLSSLKSRWSTSSGVMITMARMKRLRSLEMLHCLSEKLPAFKIHSFIKNRQAKLFTEKCAVPKPQHAVLLIYFSEN